MPTHRQQYIGLPNWMQLNSVAKKGFQRYHLAGDNFVHADGSNAVDRQHDDEDDYLYTGHPDREVRTTPPQPHIKQTSPTCI